MTPCPVAIFHSIMQSFDELFYHYYSNHFRKSLSVSQRYAPRKIHILLRLSQELLQTLQYAGLLKFYRI